MPREQTSSLWQQRDTLPARGLPAPELSADADVDEVGVHEDPPDVFPDLFEEEDDEPDLPQHDVPEPEDAHEEAPVPVLNRFPALRIVFGDGLRRNRASNEKRAFPSHDVCQVLDSCGSQEARVANSGTGSLVRETPHQQTPAQSHSHPFLRSLPWSLFCVSHNRFNVSVLTNRA